MNCTRDCTDRDIGPIYRFIGYVRHSEYEDEKNYNQKKIDQHVKTDYGEDYVLMVVFTHHNEMTCVKFYAPVHDSLKFIFVSKDDGNDSSITLHVILEVKDENVKERFAAFCVRFHNTIRNADVESSFVDFIRSERNEKCFEKINAIDGEMDDYRFRLFDRTPNTVRLVVVVPPFAGSNGTPHQEKLESVNGIIDWYSVDAGDSVGTDSLGKNRASALLDEALAVVFVNTLKSVNVSALRIRYRVIYSILNTMQASTIVGREPIVESRAFTELYRVGVSWNKKYRRNGMWYGWREYAAKFDAGSESDAYTSLIPNTSISRDGVYFDVLPYEKTYIARIACLFNNTSTF